MSKKIERCCAWCKDSEKKVEWLASVVIEDNPNEPQEVLLCSACYRGRTVCEACGGVAKNQYYIDTFELIACKDCIAYLYSVCADILRGTPSQHYELMENVPYEERKVEP